MKREACWDRTEGCCTLDSFVAQRTIRRAPFRLRLRAAVHELRCGECRVSWRSWWRRLRGV
jgi:hypothetical protein